MEPASVLKGHCVSGQGKTGAPLITSTISDFAILLLPVTILWNLQVSTKKKLGLIVLFSFGLL